jgi:hypothetical protein
MLAQCWRHRHKNAMVGVAVPRSHLLPDMAFLIWQVRLGLVQGLRKADLDNIFIRSNREVRPVSHHQSAISHQQSAISQ